VTVAKEPPKSARIRLREWLESHLLTLEMGKPSTEARKLKQLLNEAVNGLDDLKAW
jgi:hypothetical protein